MSLRKIHYQTETTQSSSESDPCINLWREVCRIAWCDYLGLERCAYEESEQKLKREAGRFLRSSEYAELAEIIDYPPFKEELFG